MASRTNPTAELRRNEKFGIYKDECKEWMKKYQLAKTWDNLKTHFTEAYFELKEDNELNKNHIGFMEETNEIKIN